MMYGEWWHAVVEAVVRQGRPTRRTPTPSTANPGRFSRAPRDVCSSCVCPTDYDLRALLMSSLVLTVRVLRTSDTYALQVQRRKTYLLRVINAAAAVNDELFFSIAGHTMTVVEIDATYTKSFTTPAIHLSPGPDHLRARQGGDQRPGRYFMAVQPFNDVPIPVDNKTATTGILQYAGVPASVVPAGAAPAHAGHERHGLRHRIPWPPVALLQAHRAGKTKGVFTADFPDRTGRRRGSTTRARRSRRGSGSARRRPGTRLSKVAYNATVELVLQDTCLLSVESHAFHLHGHNFFVVGRGAGNFDPARDPARYNLVDPPERNTVGVPAGGWAAVRFRADNPGVWLLHCHLEVYTS
ncbi:hypothetical protein ACP70R_037136 [Stipagrostis hirtigluma subsp. patula]